MILDTELANKKIDELQEQLDSVNQECENKLRKMEDRFKTLFDSNEEFHKLDHMENQMLQEENTRLLSIIEELQTELNQLKSNA